MLPTEAVSGSVPAARVVDAVRVFVSRNESVRGLQGFSIDLHAGEVCALVGISGSGKSTLLNVIGGLEMLDSGYVEVNGARVSSLSRSDLARFRRETVATVFQEYNLLPMLTSLENVSLPGQLVSANVDEVYEASRRALDVLGMADLVDRYPGELSGGQRQRVAIARAIAGAGTAGKVILLADEPTGSLDTSATRDVMHAFREAARAGLAVLVATHDPEVVATADRVVAIRDGQNAQVPLLAGMTPR